MKLASIGTQSIPLATDSRIAIVVSRFNEKVTSGLLKGALDYLAAQKVAVAESDVIEAPGAFEIPLIAQKLGQSGQYDGVVCLGCVIKGDTAHFEYISEAASSGIMSASLKTGIPVAFGILTTYTAEQAEIRSRDDEHNKGREAAAACLEAASLLKGIGA